MPGTTATRDITKIAKFEFLIPTLQAVIDGANETLGTWGAQFAKDPAYALNWIEKTYKATALRHVAGELQHIAQVYLDKRDEPVHPEAGFRTRTECTMDEIVGHAARRIGDLGYRASSEGDLMERHQLAAWIDIQRGMSDIRSAFHHAQYHDPEYKAVSDRKYAIQRAQEAQKAEQAKAIQKAERWAKTNLTRCTADGKSSPTHARPACFYHMDHAAIFDAMVRDLA